MFKGENNLVNNKIKENILSDSIKNFDGLTPIDNSSTSIDDMRFGESFYNNHISLIHKIEYINNDLFKIFNIIYNFFTKICVYDWNRDIREPW